MINAEAFMEQYARKNWIKSEKVFHSKKNAMDVDCRFFQVRQSFNKKAEKSANEIKSFSSFSFDVICSNAELEKRGKYYELLALDWLLKWNHIENETNV